MSLSEALFKPFSPSFFFIITCSFIFFSQGKPQSNKSIDHHYTDCAPKTCGNGLSISYPFRIDSQPLYCAYPSFNLSCNRDGEPVLKLPYNQNFIIRNISYENQSLLVIKEEFLADQCPHPLQNLTVEGMFGVSDANALFYFFYNCTSPPPQRPNGYPVSCVGNSTHRSFASFNKSTGSSRSCESSAIAPVLNNEGDSTRSADYLGILKMGFFLKWTANNCTRCSRSGGRCGYNGEYFACFCKDRIHHTFCKPSEEGGNRRMIKIGLIVGTTGGFLAFLCILFCFCHRKVMCSLIFFLDTTSKKDRDVEVFLENYRSLGPKRYRYFELKKMTNSFQDKLGEGGYGRVYKGKLHDGRLVAVKMLTTSKCNGEEFINEVTSIGRTHHVNVVALLGFCSEGSKRALIYEFMPNGSLEKFIYGEKPGGTTLGFEKLCEIALGVARGLEYLHRGCSTRIVHLDIKPHNILLDGNFCPKISDFGLAKVSTTKESILSMMEARGTIGYTAPEIFCRNIGGVSSKSDVYSYGMMVLEMVGGRRNIEVGVVNTSEIYFPHWIYHRIELNHQLGLNGVTTRMEEEIARKMILVGLWCIQTDPTNRPSTSRVVEMLEGSIESLAIPPKPYLSSPPRTFQSPSTKSVS